MRVELPVDGVLNLEVVFVLMIKMIGGVTVPDLGIFIKRTNAWL